MFWHTLLPFIYREHTMTDTSLYHFTPQAVAKQIDVSVQSVRRWADTYKDFLSESANPAPGKTRLYTWADVEVLRRIKELRDSGLTPEAITINLSVPTKSLPTDISAIASVAAPDAPHASPGSIVALEAMNTLQRRFEALEASVKEGKQSQRDGVVMFGIGFICALVFVVLLLLLFLLRHYL
jgi:DNA-binding transcriptional MerR regulator